MGNSKEFWIYPTGEDVFTFNVNSNEILHVIEYLAYEQLRQENAKLKEQLRIAIEALESVAANKDVGDVDLTGHFEGYQNYELVDCIVNDTELARKALKKIESAGE